MPDENDSLPVAVASATLDRAAMERVLARASELSSGASDGPDGMTEAQLIEIGKEVGLSPATLQQALAEERTRVVLSEEMGLEARVMGPAAYRSPVRCRIRRRWCWPHSRSGCARTTACR